MTENEAKTILECEIKHQSEVSIFYEALDVAIKTLEEIQSLNFSSNQLRLVNLIEEYKEKLKKYETIGTVEECRTAVEKQKAKICNLSGDGYADGHLVYDTYECPNCGKDYEIDYEEYEYCPNCGRHIKRLGGAELSG